jgi:hypothetical protein
MNRRCRCLVCLTADAAPLLVLQWLAAGATVGGLSLGGWIGWLCARRRRVRRAARGSQLEPPLNRCKSCRRAVQWVEMASSGKRMPLDVAPAANGTIVIGADGKGYVDRNPGRAKFDSHFATCPNAQQHRRARSSEGAISNGEIIRLAWEAERR